MLLIMCTSLEYDNVIGLAGSVMELNVDLFPVHILVDIRSRKDTAFCD